MASGGARARSGPAPDPNALRRDRADDQGWITLPAEGRQEKAPRWPLDGLTPREAEIWDREWKRPQAIMWERNGQEFEVALYVRRLVESEQPGTPVALASHVMKAQEYLGLSLPGMHRLRWKIAPGANGTPAETTTKEEAPKSARERLRVVSDGR